MEGGLRKSLLKVTPGYFEPTDQREVDSLFSGVTQGKLFQGYLNKVVDIVIYRSSIGTNLTYLWREGFVLVEFVGILHCLVVTLLQDVLQQPRGRSLVQLTLYCCALPLQKDGRRKITILTS